MQLAHIESSHSAFHMDAESLHSRIIVVVFSYMYLLRAPHEYNDSDEDGDWKLCS